MNNSPSIVAEWRSRSRGAMPFVPCYVIAGFVTGCEDTRTARERCALSIVSRAALNRRGTNH